MKSLYGKTSRDSKDYAINKEEDLNYRLGNRYLKELKENSKNLTITTSNKPNTTKNNSQKNNNNYFKKSSTLFISKKGIRQITEALGSEIKDQNNIMEYEKIKREQEQVTRNFENER